MITGAPADPDVTESHGVIALPRVLAEMQYRGTRKQPGYF
jgi:hypothetical protein